MNDFTKEELQMMLGGISLWLEEIAFIEHSGEPYYVLKGKLKSMIDNYNELQINCKASLATLHAQE